MVGQNTFQILLLNGANMIGEHYETRIEMLYGCRFEKTSFLPRITSFRSGGFTTATAMNQKDKNPGKSIFVHFDMTFLTTLTGIFDFANLIFQT